MSPSGVARLTVPWVPWSGSGLLTGRSLRAASVALERSRARTSSRPPADGSPRCASPRRPAPPRAGSAAGTCPASSAAPSVPHRRAGRTRGAGTGSWVRRQTGPSAMPATRCTGVPCRPSGAPAASTSLDRPGRSPSLATAAARSPRPHAARLRPTAGVDMGFNREPGGTSNSMTTGGKSYYYLTGGVGSVVALADEAGTKVPAQR